MASTIIAGSLSTATDVDLRRAKLYHGPRAWVARHGACDEHWIFERVDGGFDSFTCAELLQSPWWRFCDADEVLSIESQLQPARAWADLFVDRPISCVARSDRKAGGRLIPGSRLSEFFEGEAGFEAAESRCRELRAREPDARVFQAATIADAERMLQGIDVHAERLARRVKEIRDEQAAAHARFGVASAPARDRHPAKLQGA